MLFFQRFFLTFFLFTLGLFTVSTSADAFFAQHDPKVFLNEYKTEDMYLAGEEVTVQEDVEGDLFVAGNRVIINGNVNGDLFVAGNEVLINGSVKDDLRLASGSLILNGSVGGDTILAGESISIGKESALSGDLIIASYTADFYGTLNQSAKAYVGVFHLGGKINGNVEVRAGESIVLLRNSEVAGDFSYRAPQKIENQGGTIEGETTYKEIPADAEVWKQEMAAFLGAGYWGFKFFNFTSLLLLGGFFLIVAPHFFQKSTDQINKAPLRCLGFGFVTLVLGILVSLASLFLLVAVQLGAVVGALLFLLIQSGRVAAGYWVGSWFFHKVLKKNLDKKKVGRQSMFILLVGLLFLFMVTFIPFVGGLIQWVAFLMGVGSVFLVKRAIHAQMVNERMV